MGKSLIGLDITSRDVTMAQLSGGVLKGSARVAVERLPENMMMDSAITSPESMSAFLKSMKKKHKFSGTDCAVLLPESSTFFRPLTMPEIKEDQLRLNLPYEFRDYVGSAGNNYYYDYEVEEITTSEDGTRTMHILASAANKATLTEYASILKKAGMRMKVALPREMALMNILKNSPENAASEEDRAKNLREAEIALDKQLKAEEKAEAKAAKEAAKKAAADAKAAEKKAKQAEKERLKNMKKGVQQDDASEEAGDAAEMLRETAGAQPHDIEIPDTGAMEASASNAKTENLQAQASDQLMTEKIELVPEGEHAVIDIGYGHTRVSIFSGISLTAYKIIEIGCTEIDAAIADRLNIDPYLAVDYREKNHEGILADPAFEPVYEQISLEILKAFNFYRYEHQDSSIQNVYFCGPGSEIAQLKNVILSDNELAETPVTDILPRSCKALSEAPHCAMSIGAAMQSFLSAKVKKMNLVEKPSGANRISIVIPLAIILAVGIAALAKFGVIDRLESVNQLRNELSKLKSDLSDIKTQTEDLQTVKEQYNRYSQNYKTDDEEALQDRLEMISIIRTNADGLASVSAYTITGNTVSVTLTGSNLEALGTMREKIQTEETVESMTIISAEKKSKSGETYVQAYATISFKDAGGEEE